MAYAALLVATGFATASFYLHLFFNPGLLKRGSVGILGFIALGFSQGIAVGMPDGHSSHSTYCTPTFVALPSKLQSKQPPQSIERCIDGIRWLLSPYHTASQRVCKTLPTPACGPENYLVLASKPLASYDLASRNRGTIDTILARDRSRFINLAKRSSALA